MKAILRVHAAVREGATTSRDIADVLATTQDNACALLAHARAAGLVRDTGRKVLWEPGKKGRLCRVWAAD